MGASTDVNVDLRAAAAVYVYALNVEEIRNWLKVLYWSPLSSLVRGRPSPAPKRG